MYTIDFHADDYAITPNNCHRLLTLIKEGHLDSISIIPNMSCYAKCMDILRDEWNSLPTKPLISVHINLIDGQSLSKETAPFLSWGKLMLQAYTPGKTSQTLKKQLTAEIKAQIGAVYEQLQLLQYDNGALIQGKPALRLDSHMHTHMIPLVFDAMLDAVAELGLTDQLSYVRISKEPLMMFLTTPGVFGTFPLVNLIKNILLRTMSIHDIKMLKKRKANYCILWGLMMSGKMDTERINILLPKMDQYMQKKSSDNCQSLELICHPGIILPEEVTSELGPDDKKFLVSDNRNIEYQAMVNCCNHK